MVTEVTGVEQAARDARPCSPTANGNNAGHALPLGSVLSPLDMRARCPRHSKIFPKTQNLISVSASGGRPTVRDLQ